MIKFGLACEGITDQITIENILCGFYKDYEDLDEEIHRFQPAYDETDKKQKDGEFGGWEILFQYLSEKRFRDDVLNSEYTIIQVDTDVCEHQNFDVRKDTSSICTFIDNIKVKLISLIDKNQNFYEANKEKIIFAISIHELECWLLPIYKDSKQEKIMGCFESLKRECYSQDIKIEKNYLSYNELSKVFLKNKTLMKISSKNASFQIFLESLPKSI
ncbi:hypothetical protein [Aliarcobacter butzleri]|uniref:hypothetical protein n=1 Tax=Aliarcobacter butzleri TaxID=28197 RepID=UPI001EDC29A4|nr:hypothetical protein [Aliarcobacter butzleri]MCG3672392.1 hypothetical protein [Aliarcobacter butzleri]